MIGGKAAPAYLNAKLIIELINQFVFTVNRDTEIGDLLKVLFLPNYCALFCLDHHTGLRTFTAFFKL